MIKKYALPSIFVPLFFINIYQADNATKPGQIYRKALLSIIKDVKEQSPPQLLAENWLGFFLRDLYLKDYSDKIVVVPFNGIHDAKLYEKWLKTNQPHLPDGTMLITGLGSYIHYGAHHNGFRLRQFDSHLDSNWKLFKEYGMLNYLPYPEQAKLWRWSGAVTISKAETVTEPPETAGINDVGTLFKIGMEHFEKNNYSKARMYYKKIVQKFPNALKANDAQYFYAICYFREGDWKTTIAEFKKLIENYPKSTWIAGTHYHTGLSYKELKDIKQARREFHHVINQFPSNVNLVNLSKKQLEELPPEPVGIIERLYNIIGMENKNGK